MRNIAVVLGLAASFGFANIALAQEREAASQIAEPNPLTRQAIRELISELDDEKVRSLLIDRMTAEADRRSKDLAGGQAQSFDQFVTESGRALAAYLTRHAADVEILPDQIAEGFAGFRSARGERGASPLIVSIFASLGAGVVAALLTHRLLFRSAPGWQPRPRTETSRIEEFTTEFLRHTAVLITFVATAYAVGYMMNWQHTPDRQTTGLLISVVGWTAFVTIVVRLTLRPDRPEFRLCATDNETARFLTWRLSLAAFLFTSGFGLSIWVDRYRAGPQHGELSFWVNLALHLLLIATVWQARAGIRTISSGSMDTVDAQRSTWVHLWPIVIIALLVAHWMLVSLIAATTVISQTILPVLAATLAILIGLPIIYQALTAVVTAGLPIDPGDPPSIRAAKRKTQSGVLRIARVAVAVILLLGVSMLWGFNVMALAQQQMGARFANTAIEAMVIIGTGYILVELIGIIINRQIAIERVRLGLDRDEGQADLESEGGQPGARLGTLLPLVRLSAQISVIVLTVFAVLSEFGINVWPLVAGAGVVGLAIGFGAQTLVKDILSGAFFLIDDAFRKGEYIDVGSAKGVVEKISIRSIQLRHHNGPLNTVPFGEIRQMTNFSRDWVVMKFTLRLTYDTNAEKVRKLIKKLGEELLADPELGPKFLEPLKSQGVIEMEESAMIMRVKFMTKPGDQWGLRRVVLARLRDLFEENKIRFADRSVRVHIDDDGRDRHLSESERNAIGAAAATTVEDEAIRLPNRG